MLKKTILFQMMFALLVFASIKSSAQTSQIDTIMVDLVTDTTKKKSKELTPTLNLDALRNAARADSIKMAALAQDKKDTEAKKLEALKEKRKQEKAAKEKAQKELAEKRKLDKEAREKALAEKKAKQQADEKKKKAAKKLAKEEAKKKQKQEKEQKKTLAEAKKKVEEKKKKTEAELRKKADDEKKAQKLAKEKAAQNKKAEEVLAKKKSQEAKIQAEKLAQQKGKKKIKNSVTIDPAYAGKEPFVNKKKESKDSVTIDPAYAGKEPYAPKSKEKTPTVDKKEDIQIPKGVVQKDNAYGTVRLAYDDLSASFLLTIPTETKMSYHKEHSEHIMLVEGEGMVLLGYKTIKLKKNELIFITKGTPHKIINSGKRKLKVLSIQSPFYSGKDIIILE